MATVLTWTTQVSGRRLFVGRYFRHFSSGSTNLRADQRGVSTDVIDLDTGRVLERMPKDFGRFVGVRGDELVFVQGIELNYHVLKSGGRTRQPR